MKPSVLLEFELTDVRFITPLTSSGSTAAPPVTYALSTKAWPTNVALYAVVDGKVIPIAIPDGSAVEIVVSR